ncbi:MAG: ATP:cob(I)alamin adenosyltransferase [Streptosporangiales bacterium]
MERASEHRGITTLDDGRKVPKSDVRLGAVAHCEDATACLGLVLALGGHLPETMVTLLGGLQNDLLDVSADLHAPVSDHDDTSQVRIDTSYIDRLHYLVEYYSQDLTDLADAVVPGGTATAALIYKTRTAVRLAEVHAWEAIETHGNAVNPVAADYLDEMSHLLLVLARAANSEHGDTVWQPGLSAVEADQAAKAAATAADSDE